MKHLSDAIIESLPKGGAECITARAKEFKPWVDAVNSGIPYTQYNYGKYMDFLISMSEGRSAGWPRYLALCLIEAGGDRRGIKAAMGILGHE